ncbi:hypothetical protein DH2020_022335 [Rehmannia glutinosa]|uniref:Uncharacterized protein n=1 Tax=Rehmannia glutinosa TaxID=99300 RepID=A0ABR0WHA1_REHGL
MEPSELGLCTVCACLAKMIRGCFEVMVAEAMALREGLELAKSTTTPPPPTNSIRHHRCAAANPLRPVQPFLRRRHLRRTVPSAPPPPTHSLPLPTHPPPLLRRHHHHHPSDHMSLRPHTISTLRLHPARLLPTHAPPHLRPPPPRRRVRRLLSLQPPHHQKQLLFPTDCWPLGYDSAENDDDDVSAAGESFCLDPSCSTESADGSGLDLGSLRELGREMEKLGLVVMEKLALAIGFDNPARVGLHYQARFQKYSLLSDSGWVNVSGQVEVDSVLVTLGDVAQVWSNGKLKKVRGRPMPSVEANNNSNSNCITISLLITLPLESTVAPLVPGLAINGTRRRNKKTKRVRFYKETARKRLFNSFSFEDYAWRVYHERILLKDPLVRYRV